MLTSWEKPLKEEEDEESTIPTPYLGFAREEFNKMASNGFTKVLAGVMPVIAAPNQLVVMFTVTPGMLDPLGNLSMGFILTLTDCVTSRAARIDNQNLKTVSVTLEAKMGKSRRVVVGQVMYGRGNTDFINDNLVMGSFFFQERNGEKLDYWTGSHTMSIVKN